MQKPIPQEEWVQKYGNLRGVEGPLVTSGFIKVQLPTVKKCLFIFPFSAWAEKGAKSNNSRPLAPACLDFSVRKKSPFFRHHHPRDWVRLKQDGLSTRHVTPASVQYICRKTVGRMACKQ
jgi:hypothetical protein